MKFSPLFVFFCSCNDMQHTKLQVFATISTFSRNARVKRWNQHMSFAAYQLGCGCGKKKSPMRIKRNSLFLLCCMRACCKNAERHADSALRGGAATEDGQDI